MFYGVFIAIVVLLFILWRFRLPWYRVSGFKPLTIDMFIDVLRTKGVEPYVIEHTVFIMQEIMSLVDERDIGRKTIDYITDSPNGFTQVFPESFYRQAYVFNQMHVEKESYAITQSRNEPFDAITIELDDDREDVNQEWSTRAKKAELIFRTWIWVVVFEYIFPEEE